MLETARRSRAQRDATFPAGTVGVPANLVVGLVVLAVVPLALLQVPNLVAVAEPGMPVTGGGSRSGTELIRAAGLALPAMLLAAPVATLAARRGRAWPVLLAGLLLVGLADLGADISTGTVRGVAVDRAAHGLGAGAALAGSLALVWERRGRARQVLACLWAGAAVTAMTAAAPLIGSRIAWGGWRAALQPYPWLTGVALAATAAHVALTADDPPACRARRAGAVAPAERAQLCLLAVPCAGLCALAVGSTFGWPSSAQLTAGAIGIFLLVLLAAALGRDPAVGGAPGLPITAVAIGLATGPAAGMAESLGWLGANPANPANPAGSAATAADGLRAIRPLPAAIMLAVGAAVGAAIACAAAAGVRGSRAHGGPATGRRRTRAPELAVAAGLATVAAGLVIARVTGTDLSSGLQTLELALVAGGAAVALGAALANAPAGAAMAALPLTLAAALTGYLLAGAVQIRFLSGPSVHAAGGGPAALPWMPGALTRAAAVFELSAAWAAGLAAIGVLLTARGDHGAGHTRRHSCAPRPHRRPLVRVSSGFRVISAHSDDQPIQESGRRSRFARAGSRSAHRL